jgi:DNA-directed RNA polymerase subunit RPC12/RpoP
MMVFPCRFCGVSLSAEETMVGQWVRCPSCQSTMSVPAAGSAGAAVAPAPRLPPPSGLLGGGVGSGRRYSFNCAYCSSRLEATESMAAQEGNCPTCGNIITIPIRDRYGRLIDPKTMEIIKPPPHPVHAYAAAGDRAPVVRRLPDGQQVIDCPRCHSPSPVSANNCRACGMPFTMEGTSVEAAGSSNGFAVASLVLGIIGIPAACTVIMPLLAVIFGFIALIQTNRSEAKSGRGLAIAGLICGLIGGFIALLVMLNA